MTLSYTINIITGLLCVAVLVQSVRMMRGMRRMERQHFGEVLANLATATDAAGMVLAELRKVLSETSPDHLRQIEAARVARDELQLLIGLADARAERLAAPSPAPVSEKQATLRPDEPMIRRWQKAHGNAALGIIRPGHRDGGKPAQFQ